MKPVQNFTIETISDKWDARLTDFRKKIFEVDLGLSAELINNDKPHSWWLSNIEPKNAEDAFKYSNRKWHTVDFNNIEAIIENEAVVGISGCKAYGNFLRTSMHLYLLKSVRSVYPGIKYLKGGWFDRHVSHAVTRKYDGLFFTVYAHNKKLKGLIRNHQGKLISLVNKQHLMYIHDVQEKGEYMFNGVPQTFFYYPLNIPIEKFDPNEFI